MLTTFLKSDLTLAQCASAENRSPAAVRADYTRLMRADGELTIPDPVRIRNEDGLWKFCLPMQTSSGEIFESESVLIPMSGHHDNAWYTLCVSSQIGCRMGCTFCETGLMGLLANLTADQIVMQRLAARRFARQDIADPALGTIRPAPWRYDSDGVRNIVFMGMGEPFDNFDEVIQAIRVLSEPAGLNIPQSRITISTVGRVDGIRRLAELGWRHLRLAISLNAAHDTLRNELMPLNRSTPLHDLQKALLEFPLPPRGRFMIEYVLMKGVNDSLTDADLVAAWCRPLRCTVNLIPYNPQTDAGFQAPDDATITNFLHRLKELGIFVKWRTTHGRGLMGACGQLGNPDLRQSNRRARLASAG